MKNSLGIFQGEVLRLFLLEYFQTKKGAEQNLENSLCAFFHAKNLPILIINNHQPLQQQLIVNDDLPFAVRNNDLCQPAGGDHGTLLTDLFLDFLDNTVDAGCVAVNNTAAHAVDCVGTNHAFGRIKTDFR